MMELKPSPLLDHTVRFVSTVRGTDKFLMIIAYASKIVVWYLNRRVPDAAKQPHPLAVRVQNLAGPISDFRILLRYYGLLPLVQGIIQNELEPPSDPLLRWLERAQNVVNVIYYPLEHLYWLGAHEVIPMTSKTCDRISIWSCRAWAAYVVLQFIHLYRDFELLHARKIATLSEKRRLLSQKEPEHSVTKSNRVDGDENAGASASSNDTTTSIAAKGMLSAEEMQDWLDQEDASPRIQMLKSLDQKLASLDAERTDLIVGTIINSAYLPLTVHWSVEGSTFPQVGVGICGTIAAIFQIYSAWKATA